MLVLGSRIVAGAGRLRPYQVLAAVARAAVRAVTVARGNPLSSNGDCIQILFQTDMFIHGVAF